MAPKKNKQREKMEQSQASSRAKAQASLAGGVTGFIGFSSFAKSSSGFVAPAAVDGNHAYLDDGTSAASAIYDGADHEIAMALKMLGKKGTVTKIKALQSFLQDILPPKKGPEIRGMVGHFVQLFATELRDQKDRKVRQLMIDVLLVLATKLRPKAFAPHLRRLMPYWLVAMHDPNAEAAKTALQALETLFPDNQEMQDEVIATHLGAVLQEFSAFFEHTPESFPGVALADDDERQERYERCVTAAVLSLNTLVRRFSTTGYAEKLTDESMDTSFAGVITSGNFGRLVSATSKNASFSRDSIRKATYVTIQSLCMHTPVIIHSREEHFGKLVLGAISDKDPANQQPLWDMVLTYLKVRPSHWSQGFVKYVKSAVLPRLFAQVRHGFFGPARASFPVLLPLLSMFPLEHFLDVKTGHCALYTGVLENVWKFVASNESRFNETDAIEAASECLSAFFELFIKSPRNAAFTTAAFMTDNDAFSNGYAAQFEKPVKDAFTTMFTTSKLNAEHIELFAKSLSAMTTKSREHDANNSSATAASVATSLLDKFSVLAESWLLDVLEKAVAEGSVRATHVVTFLRLSAMRAHSTALTTVCRRLYTSCIAQLSREAFSYEVLDVMTGLYEIVGPKTLITSENGHQSVETHFAEHIQPLLRQAATSPGSVGEDVIGSALESTRHFLLAADDKQKFLLAVFQDFGVQYGDMVKASTLIEKCLRFAYSHEAATSWVSTGSFCKAKAESSQSSPQSDLLRAIWNGKLLDEFVMISLKGRLDDLDEDAFSRLLALCLGDGTYLPLISPDVVVILSHFAIQQEESHVVMRILPCLVSLFAKLRCELPRELETAEEQVLESLYHLAAKSSFTIEASELWKAKTPAVTKIWSSARREEFIKAMVKVINNTFEAEDSVFNARIWASYVNIFMLLGLHLQADSNAVSGLFNRLRVFSHRFEGSRVQLTRMYDRLLGCIAELCEDETSRSWLATYFKQLSDGSDGLKTATQLLLRWLDIDICHALTFRVLQNDSSPTYFVTVDQLSLQFVYNILKGTPTANGAFTAFFGGSAASRWDSRHRRVLFTNQDSEERNLDVTALSPLSEEQHVYLDSMVARVLGHAAQALPVIAMAIHDMDRVKMMLFEAFGSADALASWFNVQGTPLAPLVRIQFYVLATATGAFSASAGGCEGIDLNADDEDATEAALADSIIPGGLREALCNAFARSSASEAKGKTRRRQRLELDDTITRLLAWDLFLQLFPTSGGNTVGMVTSALSAFVTRHGLLSSFLDMVGTLLSQESSSSMTKRLLKDEPFFDIAEMASESLGEDSVNSSLVAQLAARAFFRTVMRLPAMVRTWWNDECSRSLRSWATKYFEEHITPYVLSTELEIIQKAADLHSWDAEEMTVKGSRVSREITTTYVKDECALEMVIRVPSAYPLRSVEVECTRRIGISEDRWRRWVLQIIKVTSAQDGSLLDAVLLWKQNVDREFEGVEPCPICYSILNPKTRGLPNLPCKTCSNKYHNSCLYKWFNQSGKNKCPICQQPFT
ncbi:hypothetical protein ATCC90586_008344 [Pythium insidiosum]|nr:hypothetical protein ATCC90586_008344 [Pythium insidiosum]